MTELAKPLSHKNVFVALAAAQAEFDPLLKEALNPAFKGEGARAKGTAYADLASVVGAVRPGLVKNGIAYFHQIIRHESGLDMRTSLVHGETDTRIDCDVPLIVAKNDMQGMKSATTYAKRVGLESVTGVAPEDDDGNAAVVAGPDKAEKKADAPQFVSPTQIDQIVEKAFLADVTAIQIAKAANVVGLDKLLAKDFATVMNKLQKTIDAKKPKDDLGDDEIPF